MSYIVNKTDGSQLTVINTGELNLQFNCVFDGKRNH